MKFLSQPFELDLVNASARKAVSKVALACHFRLKTKPPSFAEGGFFVGEAMSIPSLSWCEKTNKGRIYR